MADLLFMAGLVVWFGLIGWLPAILLPAARVPGRVLAAPVLGFALESVLASILYLCDVPAWDLFLIGSALAACGLLAALAVPPGRPDRSAALTAAIGIATALLLLLPKWTGGAPPTRAVPIRQQPRIGGDHRAAELKPQAPAECELQRPAV